MVGGSGGGGLGLREQSQTRWKEGEKVDVSYVVRGQSIGVYERKFLVITHCTVSFITK